jgi:hypothetical protein
MAPTAAAIARLMGVLRLDTPIVALYDCPPDPTFGPIVEAQGRACCFAYYTRWAAGTTVVVRRGDSDFATPKDGCPGMQRAFGFAESYPPWMASFLTDGANGAPMGEGLKASPELAQQFLDRSRAPQPRGDTLLMGPLRPERWDDVRTVTFFADPDRLSALMTLAAYWSGREDEVATMFSSGCGLMWRELANQDRDRAILGCTDIAMRRHLPPEILSLSVSPARFARMVDYPETTFLDREWWNELLHARKLDG